MALWFEITAKTPPAEVEQVSALMLATSPGGITVEEPVDLLGPEMGFRVRRGEPVLVRAYVPSSELGAVLTEDLRRAMQAQYPSVELTAKPLYEQDWAVTWREFFGIVDSGGRVLIVPSWIEHEAAEDQIAIRLDPGQAFGTGHHETTRLCIASLEEHICPGMNILDVGTGSGVLSIAAIKLGAASAVAIDIDPIAAEIARANCDDNGLGPEVAISAGRLETDHSGRYDLVVSNISTDANAALAEAFGNVLLPGARLILSGILAPDAPRVCAAMEKFGIRRTGMRYENDWCVIELLRDPA